LSAPAEFDNDFDLEGLSCKSIILETFLYLLLGYFRYTRLQIDDILANATDEQIASLYAIIQENGESSGDIDDDDLSHVIVDIDVGSADFKPSDYASNEGSAFGKLFNTSGAFF